MNCRTGTLTFFVVACLAILGGCSTWQKLDNQERGTVVGGASGAAVGSAIDRGGPAGTIIGGAVGAGAGNLVGKEMDKED